MLFTIITICYNEQKRIAQTLESIYNQEFSDYEHIIEDGGSDDDTLQIVKQYKEKYSQLDISIYSEKDNGIYDAMNRAVRRAKGDYICFINSGDFLLNKNTLYDIHCEIDKAPGMDWYYGKCVYIFPNKDEYIQVPVSIENIEGEDMRLYLETHSLNLNHQSIFAKRECLLAHPFDVSYKLRAELKWYYECLLSNIKVKKLDFPVSMYSLGGFSERVDSVKINSMETERIYAEFGLKPGQGILRVPKADDYGSAIKYIYSEWLALLQAGKRVADYLRRQGINSVAIYGYGELGTHLIAELKHSGMKITCILDKSDKYAYSDLPVIKPDRYEGDSAEAMIVTAVTHFHEIYSEMSTRVKCPIYSLEHILEDMW